MGALGGGDYPLVLGQPGGVDLGQGGGQLVFKSEHETFPLNNYVVMQQRCWRWQWGRGVGPRPGAPAPRLASAKAASPQGRRLDAPVGSGSPVNNDLAALT